MLFGKKKENNFIEIRNAAILQSLIYLLNQKGLIKYEDYDEAMEALTKEPLTMLEMNMRVDGNSEEEIKKAKIKAAKLIMEGKIKTN